MLELEDGGNVHDGREGVVGRGRAVDVVVGVYRLLAAHLASEDLDGTVADDLVGVHVGLGAGAGLPDNKGEVVDQLEVSDLLCSLLDGLADFRVWMAAEYIWLALLLVPGRQAIRRQCPGDVVHIPSP